MTETLRKKGYNVVAANMSIDTIDASHRLSKELQIKENASVIKVQRVQTADGRPVAIMKNYLIPNMVEGLENYIDKFTSLYEFLECTLRFPLHPPKTKYMRVRRTATRQGC